MNLEELYAKLETIIEINRYQERFTDVEGFLLDSEGYALMALATEGSCDGEIVEIGSFMGRSTCWLATGSKGAGRGKVFAVDHFRGSPEHQKGEHDECEVLLTEGSTLGKFNKNITNVGIDDYVVPIVASSEEAVKDWDKPIRLLFIDGDHSYEESKKDFELWSPFVVDGGLIAFHDVQNAEGVTRFYVELMSAPEHFVEIMQVCSLAVIQKVPQGVNNSHPD